MNADPPGGERCKQCGRTFSSAKGLRQHIRQRHPGVENDGLCSDCGLWAPLIARGLCNTCMVFRFRSNVGTCSVCGQQAFVGKLGRCRRCLVAGARSGVRYPGRPMTVPLESGSADGAPGVQLFFAGMRDAGRWLAADQVHEPAHPADRAPEGPCRRPGPGQLPLLWIPADLTRIGLEEAERATCAERPGLFTSVERFGQARGWPKDTVRSVQHGVVLLLAARSGEYVVDPAALDHLAARHIPLQPSLDFLSEIDVAVVDDEGVMDDWLDDRLAMLPGLIRSEVTSWLDVLRGRSKRRRRSYRPNTVKAFAACANRHWPSGRSGTVPCAR